MKKRSYTSIAAMIALFSTLLAACGSGSPNAGPSAAPGGLGASPSPNDAASPSPDGKKTSVQFWYSLGGKNAEYIEEMIGKFNASQSGIEVIGTHQGNYAETVTKLQQGIASGTAPDVSMLERSYVELFAESEVLEDLMPYLSASGMAQSDFSAGLMGHSIFDGKVLALPFNRSTPILHVNKTLLDDAGLQVPTTWEEMRATAEAIVRKENGDITRYGLSMPYDTWYPIALISQAGGKFFNDNNTSVDFVDNGVGEKAFGYLKELQRTGALFYPPAQDSGNIVNQMFTSGKVAMMFQSTGNIGGLSGAVDFDYVTAFLPKGERYATPTGGGNIVMLEGSENKEAAWEFLRWMMTDDEGAQHFIVQSGYLPFTEKMVESGAIREQWANEPNPKVAYDQLQYAEDTNKDVAWPEVMDEFFSAIEAIMYDSEDIASTLGTFKKSAERILAQ